ETEQFAETGEHALERRKERGDRHIPLREPGPSVGHDRLAGPRRLLDRVEDRLRFVLHDDGEEDRVARSLEEVADQLPRFVGFRGPAVGDRDHAALHQGGGVLLVFLRDRHDSDGREDRGASKGSRAISTLNKVNLRPIRNACGESNGLARTMRAARFAPIPGRAEMAANGAWFTSSGYSTAVRDRCPWLTTRTSTNRSIPVRYGNPTRIGYVPICRPYVT